MVGIDFTAVGLLAVAYLLSRVGAIPLRVRHGIFAAALFAIAGLRVARGATQGINLIFVVLALVLGLMYAVQAARGPRS
jgi:uncharacterized membrane protein (UPF0136 family)